MCSDIFSLKLASLVDGNTNTTNIPAGNYIGSAGMDDEDLSFAFHLLDVETVDGEARNMLGKHTGWSM